MRQQGAGGAVPLSPAPERSGMAGEVTAVSEQDRIEVAVVPNAVCLRPCGFATQANCLAIPDFLDGMFRSGCLFVIFDLEECKGMDSTFLGVIAKAATALSHRPDKTAIIVNAGPERLRQLQRVGLSSLVEVHGTPCELPEAMEMRRIDLMHFPGDLIERLEKIRDLHEQLVQLNERNRRTFEPFLTMLAQELRQKRRAHG